MPFGIAQIGKAFRNEISPGNFVFRMREFEQMEMQYFVRPDAAAAAFEEWLPRRRAWYERYGVTPSRLRFREHAPDELAHYAKKAIDVEYRFPFGWKELEGVHNRGDFDLSHHAGRRARTSSTSTRRPRSTSSRGSSRRRRAVTVRRSRSSSTPTARRRSAARSGSRSRCTRTWRRTRSRCCRC